MALTATDVQSAIRAANDVFEAKVAARDAAGIAALYTDDAVLMPPNSDFARGVVAIRDFFRAALDTGVSAIRLKTADVEVIGDTAIEVGTWTMHVGPNVADEGKYLVVWKQRPGGDWRLHRDIFNSSRPAAK